MNSCSWSNIDSHAKYNKYWNLNSGGGGSKFVLHLWTSALSKCCRAETITSVMKTPLLLLPLLPCNTQPYLSCVSPAFTLILPTVSCGFILGLPQGIMVCTRSHTFLHRADPSQCNFSIISSPKSLSRVIRKVKLLLPKMLSVLFFLKKKKERKDKT